MPDVTTQDGTVVTDQGGNPVTTWEPTTTTVGSGPPYPRPTPQDTEIGRFIPGQPLADLPALSPWDTVFAQYANSPGITSIIESMFGAIDQTVTMDTFFDNVWNVDTAVGYGLDIWGRIVGIGRVISLTEQAFLGFAQAGLPGVGWSQGPFYSGKQLTYNYQLSDETYRNLILAKALANVCNGSLPSINRILLQMFRGRGNCWVAEHSGYVPYFGFEQAGAAAYGFDQAPFYPGAANISARSRTPSPSL